MSQYTLNIARLGVSLWTNVIARKWRLDKLCWGRKKRSLISFLWGACDHRQRSCEVSYCNVCAGFLLDNDRWWWHDDRTVGCFALCTSADVFHRIDSVLCAWPQSSRSYLVIMCWQRMYVSPQALESEAHGWGAGTEEHPQTWAIFICIYCNTICCCTVKQPDVL